MPARAMYAIPKPAVHLKVSQILGFGDDVRLLNCALERTAGKNPRYYIRPLLERPGGNGKPIKAKERIYLESTTKQAALKERTLMLERLNKRSVVLSAQVTMGEFLDEYLRRFVRRPGVIASTTRGKYESHIKNHIRPRFADVPMAMMNMGLIQDWLDSKEKLSDSTKSDLRNILCGVFTQAEEWGYWRDRKNPARSVRMGAIEPVRHHRKLTVEQTMALLASLPQDVRLICEVALSLTLRISEVLGLRESNFDATAGTVTIDQRYHRGDVNRPKTSRAKRVLPLEWLTDRVASLVTGNPDAWLFSIRTKTTRKTANGVKQCAGRVCRDDNSMRRYFLRPAAERLGLYYPGFGFHSFRREAITELRNVLPASQVQMVSGHATKQTNDGYVLADSVQIRAGVRAIQERFMGQPAGGVQ